MFQYILFDLDGTLTDPKIGITSSVQYALKNYGIYEPDLEKLTPFIGPPLLDSFMEYYGFSEEQGKEAIEKYRERFSTIGLYENEVYPGIPMMLEQLSKKGIHLAVASSKPTIFVEKILTHFSIRSYFEVVVGSELDGRRTDKAEVVDEALSRLGVTPGKKQFCAMVGDRKFDIEGAKAHGVTAVGVQYGYAQEDELQQAAADYVAETVEELAAYLSDSRPKVMHKSNQGRNTDQKSSEHSLIRKIWHTEFPRTLSIPVPEKSSFAKAFGIISPILIYYVVNNLLVIGMAYLIQWLSMQTGGLQGMASFLALHSTAVSTGIRLLGMTIGALILLPAFRIENPIFSLHKIEKMDLLLLAALGAVAALFMNAAFDALHITESSRAYQQVADNQFALPLFWGLILYGMVSPLAEELVFRGLVYNRLRRQYPYPVAVVASSILFGVFHGNVVQAAYGFILGLLLTWTYERYGSFLVPVLLHAMANISVYLVMGIPGLKSGVMSIAGVVILGLLTIGCKLLLIKRYGQYQINYQTINE